MMRGSSAYLKIVLSAVALILAAAAQMHGAEKTIQPGDKVKVVNGPAPVKVGKDTLTTVKTGTELEALKIQGSWVKVTVQRDGKSITGWIHSKYLSSVAGKTAPEPTAKPADEKTIQPGDRLRVINGPAPVRDGAKTLATAETGTELTALRVQGLLVEVTVTKLTIVDGDDPEEKHERITAWIHTKHLTLVARVPTKEEIQKAIASYDAACKNPNAHISKKMTWYAKFSHIEPVAGGQFSVAVFFAAPSGKSIADRRPYAVSVLPAGEARKVDGYLVTGTLVDVGNIIVTLREPGFQGAWDLSVRRAVPVLKWDPPGKGTAVDTGKQEGE